MGALDDTRKILQDFLAPELRAIAVRLDAVEKRLDRFERQVDERFEKMDKRFEQVDKRFEQMDKHLVDMEARIEQRASERQQVLLRSFSDLMNYTELRDRMERLEKKAARQKAFEPKEAA